MNDDTSNLDRRTALQLFGLGALGASYVTGKTIFGTESNPAKTTVASNVPDALPGFTYSQSQEYRYNDIHTDLREVNRAVTSQLQFTGATVVPEDNRVKSGCGEDPSIEYRFFISGVAGCSVDQEGYNGIGLNGAELLSVEFDEDPSCGNASLAYNNSIYTTNAGNIPETEVPDEGEVEDEVEDALNETNPGFVDLVSLMANGINTALGYTGGARALRISGAGAVLLSLIDILTLGVESADLNHSFANTGNQFIINGSGTRDGVNGFLYIADLSVRVPKDESTELLVTQAYPVRDNDARHAEQFFTDYLDTTLSYKIVFPENPGVTEATDIEAPQVLLDGDDMRVDTTIQGADQEDSVVPRVDSNSSVQYDQDVYEITDEIDKINEEYRGDSWQYPRDDGEAQEKFYKTRVWNEPEDYLIGTGFEVEFLSSGDTYRGHLVESSNDWLNLNFSEEGLPNTMGATVFKTQLDITPSTKDDGTMNSFSFSDRYPLNSVQVTVPPANDSYEPATVDFVRAGRESEVVVSDPTNTFVGQDLEVDGVSDVEMSDSPSTEGDGVAVTVDMGDSEFENPGSGGVGSGSDSNQLVLSGTVTTESGNETAVHERLPVRSLKAGEAPRIDDVDADRYCRPGDTIAVQLENAGAEAFSSPRSFTVSVGDEVLHQDDLRLDSGEMLKTTVGLDGFEGPTSAVLTVEFGDQRYQQPLYIDVPARMMGDLRGTGRITTDDAEIAQKLIIGKDPGSGAVDERVADVDGNGDISGSDVTDIHGVASPEVDYQPPSPSLVDVTVDPESAAIATDTLTVEVTIENEGDLRVLDGLALSASDPGGRHSLVVDTAVVEVTAQEETTVALTMDPTRSKVVPGRYHLALRGVVSEQVGPVDVLATENGSPVGDAVSVNPPVNAVAPGEDPEVPIRIAAPDTDYVSNPSLNVSDFETRVPFDEGAPAERTGLVYQKEISGTLVSGPLYVDALDRRRGDVSGDGTVSQIDLDLAQAAKIGKDPATVDGVSNPEAVDSRAASIDSELGDSIDLDDIYAIQELAAGDRTPERLVLDQYREPSSVSRGDTRAVDIIIKNDGEVRSTRGVVLRASPEEYAGLGRAVDAGVIDVAPGESQRIELTIDPEWSEIEPGRYNLYLDGAVSQHFGSFEVTE